MAVRKKQGITQEQLSYQTDISLSQIARIETGKINATIDTIHKLAQGMGVTTDTLFKL